MTGKCLIFIFDSLRHDYVTGDRGELMHNLAQVAEDGVSFTSAYSQGIWTNPSSASIFTGLYPQKHGSQEYEQPLPETVPHIADDLDEIKTACFSTTPAISPKRGFKQEFDEFHQVGDDQIGLKPNVMEQLNSELIPWLKKNAGSDYLAVVWAMGTHHPFVTPDDVDDPDEPIGGSSDVPGSYSWMSRQPQEKADEVKQLYRSVIRHSDEKFGEVVETLKKSGNYDDTDIIVTSDHGEVFDEYARIEALADPLKQVFL
jgi:arylsulfatase A-like enzyme